MMDKPTTSGKKVIDGWALREWPEWWQCPFCLEPVGLVGRGFAFLFGTGFHGCDFRNVMHPQEYEYWRETHPPKAAKP